MSDFFTCMIGAICLVVLLALATGCGPVPPVPPVSPRPAEAARTYLGRGLVRVDDRGVTCYTYYQNSISCVVTGAK